MDREAYKSLANLQEKYWKIYNSLVEIKEPIKVSQKFIN